MIAKGIYRHYKGKLYFVEGVAVRSGTEDQEEERVVVYRPLYGHWRLTFRPLGEFLSRVERDGKLYERFVCEVAMENIPTDDNTVRAVFDALERNKEGSLDRIRKALGV